MRSLAIGLMLAALVAAACSGSPESTKYKQTWTKAYAETVCTDWADAMDAHQQFVMAADMLLSAQRRDNADAPIPSDALIGQFQGYIDGVCLRADAGTTEISTVAFLAYSASDQFKP